MIDRFVVPKAIGFVASGFALYVLMDTIIKWLAKDYSLSQVVFFNAAFALVPILGLSFKMDRFQSLKTQRLGFHVLRGFLVTLATYSAFFGYSKLPLSDAYSIAFSSPFFITIFSVWLLKEKVDFQRWIAVLIGFCGVLYMLRPDQGIFSIGAIGPLGAAILIAFGIIIVRKIGVTELSVTIGTYSNSVIALISGSVMLATGFITPSLHDLGLFILCGLIGGIADICMFSGFRRAQASILAPFQYTQIIWGTLYGALIFGDYPTLSKLVGACVVILSGLYIFYRETKLERLRRV